MTTTQQPVITKVIRQDDSSIDWSSVFRSHMTDFFLKFGQFTDADYGQSAELSWYRTGIPCVFLNGVTQADFGENLAEDALDTKIAEVVQSFKSRSVPFIWLTESATRPANLGERLEQHGLVYAEDWVRMSLDLDQVVEKAAPAGLEIKVSRDLEFFKDWIVPIKVGFYVPDGADELLVERMAELRSRANINWYQAVGYMDGQPVSTVSILMYEDGIASMDMVATVPEYRQRGIASALARAGFAAAKEQGYRTVILHAEPMGTPVYEKLGFKDHHDNCKMYVYMEEAPE